MMLEVLRFYNKNKKIFLEIFSNEEFDQSVEVALQLDPPRFAETILVPFKEQIVYFAMLKSWDGGIDPDSVTRLQKSYESLRNTVIKKL